VNVHDDHDGGHILFVCSLPSLPSEIHHLSCDDCQEDKREDYQNDLLPRFQSACRKRHSTEIAMLRVWSDHQYADVSQVYISTMINEAARAVQRFTACVAAISDWMSASRLKLNPTKTEVLCLDPVIN